METCSLIRKLEAQMQILSHLPDKVGQSRLTFPKTRSSFAATVFDEVGRAQHDENKENVKRKNDQHMKINI